MYMCTHIYTYISHTNTHLAAVDELVVRVPIPGSVRIVHGLEHRGADAEPPRPQFEIHFLL